MEPTIGRIVLYKLNQQNVDEITRRRTTGQSISERIKEEKWPIGAQAHIGNPVAVGDILPMVIVATWGGSSVNGQVLLDGSDNYWVTSAPQGDEPGEWNWPVIKK